MSRIKRALFLLLLVTMILLSMSAVNADEISAEFKIGDKKFTTTEGVTTLEAPPYINKSTIMVPMRAIFEELGYMVDFDSATNRIISSNGYKRIVMTLGNTTAYVDGVAKALPLAPEKVNGRTFLPLRFVSENSGAAVGWKDASSPITVTKDKRPDIGSFILSESKYEKDRSKTAVLDIFRKGKAERIEIKRKEVTSILPLKASFIINVFDPLLNTTEVFGYDGTLTSLLKDYDVRNSFEFNNNLILHMYNRITKMDELWRYDGTQLVMIDPDFSMGVFVLYEGQVLVSKSNSSRQYSIVRFTNASWDPELVMNGSVPYDFVIKDYVIKGDVIYLLGTKASGSEVWLYTYKISGLSGTIKPIAIPTGQKVTLADVFQTDANIYVKLNSVLHVLTETELKPVEFRDEASTFVHLKIGDAQVINSKLYAVVTGLVTSIESVKTSTDYRTQTDVRYDTKSIANVDKTFLLCMDNSLTFTPSTQYTKYVYTEAGGVTSSSDYKNMRCSTALSALAYYRNTPSEMLAHPKKDTKIASMRLFEEQLYLLGTNFGDDYFLITWDVSTLKMGTLVLDIVAITDMVKLPDGTVIMAVKDFNRLNGSERYAMLAATNGVYKNIAVDIKELKMTIKGKNLLVYGQDTDLKLTKLFNYFGNTFASIGNSFALSKWYDYKDGLTFVSGKADGAMDESLFLLTQGLNKSIAGFTLEKMVRLTPSIYGVVGKYNSGKIDPDFKSKKLMIIYDAVTGKNTVVKAGSNFEIKASEYEN